MAMTITQMTTKMLQFEAKITSNFPGLADRWVISSRPDRITFHFTGADIPGGVRGVWDETEALWWGEVGNTRYDGADALATLQATFAAAKAAKQAEAAAATSDSGDFTDTGP